MATVTATPTSSGSLSISGTTQRSGTISWTAPSVPSGETISSCVLTGTATASMSKGSATITVNGSSVTSGQQFTINLGTANTTTSVTTTAKGGKKNASGTVSFSNLLYTVTYEEPTGAIESLSFDVNEVRLVVGEEQTITLTAVPSNSDMSSLTGTDLSTGTHIFSWSRVSREPGKLTYTITAKAAGTEYFTVTDPSSNVSASIPVIVSDEETSSDITLYIGIYGGSGTVTIYADGELVCTATHEVTKSHTIPGTSNNITINFNPDPGYVLERYNFYGGDGFTNNFTDNPYTTTFDILSNYSELNVYFAEEVLNYTVTFKDYDGTVINSYTAPLNSIFTVPSDPVRDGYTFMSWSNDELGEYSGSDLSITTPEALGATGDIEFIAQYTGGGEPTYISNLYLGNVIIDNLYLGNIQVNKIYIGDNLIYNAAKTEAVSKTLVGTASPSSGGPGDQRITFDWDTSSIPDNAEITKVTFSFDVTYGNTSAAADEYILNIWSNLGIDFYIQGNVANTNKTYKLNFTSLGVLSNFWLQIDSYDNDITYNISNVQYQVEYTISQ